MRILPAIYFCILCLLCLSCAKKDIEKSNTSFIPLDSLILMKTNLPNGMFKDVVFMNSSDTGFAIGTNRIFKTVDGGINWREIKTNIEKDINLIEINFFDNNNGLVTGYSENIGIIMYTKDAGENWIYAKKNEQIRPSNISILNKTTAFVLANNETLYKTNDSGLQWEEVKINGNKQLQTMRFKNSSEGMVCGGSICHYTKDGGENWWVSTGIQLNGILNIKYINNYTILVGNLSIEKIPDFGPHSVASTPAYLTDIYFFSPDSLIATGFLYPDKGVFSNGVIYSSTDFLKNTVLKNFGSSIASAFTKIYYHKGGYLLIFGLNFNGAYANATIFRYKLNSTLN